MRAQRRSIIRRGWAYALAAAVFFSGAAAMAELQAGVARISITPLEEGIPTQLGGYGDRAGKPAVGVHDTIYAKILVFDHDGERSALVTLDVCHLPKGLVDDTLERAQVEGLTYANTLMAASHTHAGLEGMSMDRRNIANNPHIGIFSEDVLNFVAKRLAQGLQEAVAQLRPVTAGTGVAALPGFNRNRRHDGAPTDEDMTVLRFDTEDGKPYVVLVNYTAHGTIMTSDVMHVSGGWPGVMQRTVEDIVGEGVTCMYTNGSEGDVAPRGYTGGSRFEMAEQYGRRVGLRAADLAQAVATRPIKKFSVDQHWVDLPERVAAPDFMKIAGDEYQVDEAMLNTVLNAMFPSRAPLYLFRVNDFAMLTFPGEPITAIGLAAKEYLEDAGIRHHTVAALTNDLIGYILTKDEYNQSGYEVTASFYGDTLGEVILNGAAELVSTALPAE